MNQINVSITLQPLQNGRAALIGIMSPSKCVVVPRSINLLDGKEYIIHSVGSDVFRSGKATQLHFSDDSCVEEIIGNKNYSFINELIIPKSLRRMRNLYYQNLQSLIVPPSCVNFVMGDDNIVYQKSNSAIVFIPMKSKRITIRESATQLMPFIFNGRDQVQKVLLPSTLMNIPASIFENNKSLKILSIASDSSIQHISKNSFKMSNIAKFCCPRNVKTIKESAFGMCTKLKDFVFEDNSNLIEIDKFAFQYSGIISFNVPESVEVINDRAFINCENLTSFFFSPNSKITVLNESLFNSCGKLTKIVIPSSVNTICNFCFYMCVNLETVQFAKNSRLTTIGNKAFCLCNQIKTLNFPESLITIGDNCFDRCIYLIEVTFDTDSQIETIKNEAFSHCYGLERIHFPSSLRKIGSMAFRNTSLKDIYFDDDSKMEVNGISNTAFFNCSELVIHCPDRMKDFFPNR